MIGLSLMLGMGMENGVLITHDYLSQRGPYRMSASTGVAVVLNTLTTMVGFAVLIIADHRGLQSLGRLLTIGMTCCLFSSLVTLPVLLVLLSRSRTAGELRPARLPQMGWPDGEAGDAAGLRRRVDAGNPPDRPQRIVPRRVAYRRISAPEE